MTYPGDCPHVGSCQGTRGRYASRPPCETDRVLLMRPVPDPTVCIKSTNNGFIFLQLHPVRLAV